MSCEVRGQEPGDAELERGGGEDHGVDCEIGIQPHSGNYAHS